jgi:hypothetical protein
MKRSSSSVAVLTAVVVMALAGCSWGRQQINQADLETRVARVVPGQTTAAELEELAGGPPTSITPIGQKQLYAYTFGDSKSEALTLLIINIGKTNTGLDTALFLIDENGIVESSRVGTNSKDLLGVVGVRRLTPCRASPESARSPRRRSWWRRAPSRSG